MSVLLILLVSLTCYKVQYISALPANQWHKNTELNKEYYYMTECVAGESNMINRCKQVGGATMASIPSLNALTWFLNELIINPLNVSECADYIAFGGIDTGIFMSHWNWLNDDTWNDSIIPWANGCGSQSTPRGFHPYYILYMSYSNKLFCDANIDHKYSIICERDIMSTQSPSPYHLIATMFPTKSPSNLPSACPTDDLTSCLSILPSNSPSRLPSETPTALPLQDSTSLSTTDVTESFEVTGNGLIKDSNPNNSETIDNIDLTVTIIVCIIGVTITICIMVFSRMKKWANEPKDKDQAPMINMELRLSHDQKQCISPSTEISDDKSQYIEEGHIPMDEMIDVRSDSTTEVSLEHVPTIGSSEFIISAGSPTSDSMTPGNDAIAVDEEKRDDNK